MYVQIFEKQIQDMKNGNNMKMKGDGRQYEFKEIYFTCLVCNFPLRGATVWKIWTWPYMVGGWVGWMEQQLFDTEMAQLELIPALAILEIFLAYMVSSNVHNGLSIRYHLAFVRSHLVSIECHWMFIRYWRESTMCLSVFILFHWLSIRCHWMSKRCH